MIKHLDQLRTYLDDAEQAEDWLRSLGIQDTVRAHRNLRGIAEQGLKLDYDLVLSVCQQITKHLPQLSDPDMALNNLERFFDSARSPLSLGTLFQRDEAALPILLQIFSTSQYLSNVLITDGGSYDLLRMTEGEPVKRETLMAEIRSEIMALDDIELGRGVLRRYLRRETLRISYGDLIRQQRMETVTAQISYLADSLVDAAVRFAWRHLAIKRGQPRGPDGRVARFVVLGMGKLGGEELNYSSDIDLIFLYDHEGNTDGPKPQSNHEFFDRLGREVISLLTDRTKDEHVYRVDMRLRPYGNQGPMVTNLESALQYYDVHGRTWERQAYVKARPVAGDVDLGDEFLQKLESWIYSRYLGYADISGIKALKRRIEQRAQAGARQARNVKTGYGGIRDIEFMIQFLQLLNGGDMPEVRIGNTLQAITALESAGCLTPQERLLLERNYVFLRNIEHRLQIMFNLQKHVIPDDPEEIRKLAIRMGYADEDGRTAREVFEEEYRQATDQNRTMQDVLLSQAFHDDEETEPVVDLVLDPDPSAVRIEEILSDYRFDDIPQAYRNLMGLATEKLRFLSPRRCRHFLAAIAPRLLEAIAETPDPDMTLVHLLQISDSLGGKSALWGLFSFNEPSLRLCVEMCATSPLLSDILTSNPGMIDELMDSLMLDKLPRLKTLRSTLAELCRGAEDLDPILHSFKNAEQLSVGVREILGKEGIKATTRALSDIAEACLKQITTIEYERLSHKLGTPLIGSGPREGEPCELLIVAMGKFGGRELNYLSDLDLIFLYDADGKTQPPRRLRGGEPTTNQHFFSELGQRVIKASNFLGPHGRLYEIDPRLRPTGRSGPLATSLDELKRYFASGDGQLWERMALCRSRVVYGSADAEQRAMDAIGQAAFAPPWSETNADEIRSMRKRLEETVSANNLKRGPGGLVDIEFSVQLLQLKHANDDAALRKPNTLDAIASLSGAGLLGQGDAEHFDDSYRFLRTMEARLQLMQSAAPSELPREEADCDKLARVLHLQDGDALREKFTYFTQENRKRFEQLINDNR